ncbi:RES family NAD+ phosphorylase [Chitinimonas sp. PSY-7]|uniref:type II RES/Xre toxin-antitoxin system toxin n=1 Tax=Chitinimonas sp. PSY-7 TaxID=3459088 RepID=UPI00403FEE23
MQAWRICDARYAHDLSGSGAAIYGGRWNPVGTPAVYVALNPATAALETFAHLGNHDKQQRVLVTLTLPDEPTLYTHLGESDLPAGWDSLPPGPASMECGEQFLLSAAHLGLVLPSILVPEARNIVLNPRHPGFAQVTVAQMRPFTFDARLYGKSQIS